MRRVTMFLIALGLGALAVVGQDEDPNAELKAQIDKLIVELGRRQQKQEENRDLRVVLKSYDVSDLCSPVQDESMPPTTLHGVDLMLPEPPEYEPRATYEVDMLIELVRNLVAPASWDTVEGADIMPRGTRLVVATLPAIQKRIPPLLNQLRAFLDPQVSVDVVALPVTAATAALLKGRPRELTDEEAKALLKIEPLGAARVACFDGQQVVSRNGRRVDYLADYAVKVNEKAAMGDPQRAEVFTGCAAQIRACLDRKGDGVVLHCLLELSKVEEPMRRKEIVHGPLDLPALRLTRVHTSLWAPLGRTVVIGGATTGDRSCVFLATARRVIPR